jgi:hypothetical protein
MNHHFRTFVSTVFTLCLLTTFLISGDRIAAKSPTSMPRAEQSVVLQS